MASSSTNFPPQPAILSRAPTRNSNPFPGLSSGDAGPPEDNCVNHDALASLTLGRSHGAESSMAALDADSILCVASFLRLADVLNLCAASREWDRLFRHAVTRLNVSKVSLGGAPLHVALQALCARLPALQHFDLRAPARATPTSRSSAGRAARCTRCASSSARSPTRRCCAAARAPALHSLHIPAPRRLRRRRARLPAPAAGRPDGGGLKLRTLVLAWCDVSDRALTLIASRLSLSIKHLDVSGCARVTDDGVRVLVAQCRVPSSLLLEGCREVSGWAVSGAARTLQTLSLGGHAATDAGIGALTSCGGLLGLACASAAKSQTRRSRRSPPTADCSR